MIHHQKDDCTKLQISLKNLIIKFEEIVKVFN